MSANSTLVSPQKIWLEPAEDADPYTGRQWCEDDVWGNGVEYVRADALEAVAARNAELEAGLITIRDKQDGCYRAADCQAVAHALLDRSPS